MFPQEVSIVEVGPRDGLQNEKQALSAAQKIELINLLSNKNIHYSALTPNLKGLEAAIEAGVKEVAVFGAASESFSQKNINCSISESLKRFEAVFDLADKSNIKVRGYVSCVMGCPYEGDIAPEAVTRVSKELLDMGCYEVSLGDTIGVGTPMTTKLLLDDVLKEIDVSKVAAHFHDTYGQALVNLYTALGYGISMDLKRQKEMV
jgi:hydroxymethylglutaryl-CoA lyase